MDMQTAYTMIERNGLVAGLRGDFPPAKVIPLAHLLMEEGFNIFELTMNSVQPIEAMEAIKREFGDSACVGMGTVLDVGQARRVLDAGADMVISPAFNRDVIVTVHGAGVLMCPGVQTPTEIADAWGMGCKILKIFPIGALGIDYFKALRGPFDDVKFMCNGAMTDQNVGAFMQAGAVACGMAAWMTGDGAMSHDLIRQRARTVRHIVDGIRQPAGVRI